MADGTRRSRTAQAVAAERAVLTRMGVLDDPYARRMLSPSMGAMCWAVEHGPARLRTGSVTLAGLAARVLWFDAQVTDAIAAGIDQVVVIGAGYDARSWRFGQDGVRFYELDHRGTQQDKARRAPEPGPTYVEADLTIEAATEALGRDGFDASRPALFVVEGVTMYLAEPVVREQLTGLARSSAVGSRLAVDFYPRRDAETATAQRQHRLQQLARAGSDEGFRLQVERPEAVELVTASGWEVVEDLGLRAAAQALVPRSSGLRIDAVDDHKSLVAAVRRP